MLLLVMLIEDNWFKGWLVVFDVIVCVYGSYFICLFKMVDEDDEKFLYGGKEKFSVL